METEKRKVLIEGGMMDDWSRVNSVHPTELPIPRNVTKLDIRRRGSSYVKSLRLIYKWEGRDFLPTNPLEDKDITYLIDGHEIINSVTTVIIDDGRIFHDISLFEDHSPNNRSRLDRYLQILIEKNNGYNPVRLFFTPDARQLFINTPIEIYND